MQHSSAFLVVTPHLVMVGVAWAMAIGFFTGILPALRAARIPVAVALSDG